MFSWRDELFLSSFFEHAGHQILILQVFITIALRVFLKVCRKFAFDEIRAYDVITLEQKTTGNSCWDSIVSDGPKVCRLFRCPK